MPQKNPHIPCIKYFQKQIGTSKFLKVKCNPTKKKLSPEAFLFLLIGLHFPPHCAFGKSKKNKKQTNKIQVTTGLVAFPC